ncbi:uncharacterized protein F5147DRAFT_657174 [Suillus discolor]|uniref:CxC2-like cysteine cluster KDZ transposase-associated domain-containing protein n=1 Tax=Suillus discolor TaxID=1912936 RepID=A0A9P7EW23_9AGAM|nr:uncharacterized protein F5147DRAFT_657174 [Suillus discolor]KAG2094414.1 hypothetical protein F5147DRAFT_657174 [Suillus discolor]
MPYMAKPEEFVTVHEGSLESEEAVNAMAEECFLYSYQGIFYNMPSQCDLEPPFYCVTQGRYIRVFPSYIWDGVKLELRTPGNRVATYFTVRSPVLGEQKVHCAIQPTQTVNHRNQQRMSTDPTYAVGSSEAGTSSIQTIYCEVMSRVPKKRKKKPKLNVYHSVPVPSRQHTEYQAHQDGSITYMLKRLKPPKNAQATINNRTHATLTLHDAAPLSIPEPLDDLPLDVSLDFLGQQRRKRAAGDHPLLMWLKHRELFWQEMICLEGRCNRLGAQSCSECNCHSPEYRCWDCLGSEIYCSPCILLAHVRHPLHRLEKWNSQYFERISLKTLGLRIQLGHTTGLKCPNPCRAFNDDFIVVDTHSIHEVSLDFCNCATAQSHIQQLLQISWFPLTTSDPKTAATFRVLEHYHLLSFESKVSAFEFYNALSRMFDNTGLLPIKHAHTQGRISQLVGKMLFNNVNFRLKRKAVSSDSVDPSLSRGWGYFVEDKAYKDFLHSGVDSIQEKSMCSSHNAVNMADTKSNRGLATTGLGTVDCARHNMKLPNAVGDLQKGERYINMDYLFFSALHHTVLDTLNVSYDIAEGKMVQQSNTLQRRIDTWMKMQELYMPSLAALRVSKSSVSGSVTAAPEAIKLWLPSQISRTTPCNSHLQAIKWKLRYAQAHDALRSLHSTLRAQTAILKYKDCNLHGQGANTRARNTLKAVEARIEAAARTYEYAHKALVVLSPQTHRQADLRIEWCKARARAMRWTEEVELVNISKVQFSHRGHKLRVL